MKKLFTLLVCLICLQPVNAQTYVTIPDANFVAWLQLKIPSAMSGNQMDITSPAVTNRIKVDLSAQNIIDLTGIEYFTSLDTFRYAGGTASVLPALPNSVSFIDINYGEFVTIISLPASLKALDCQINQLTTLPALPASLVTLTCRTNSLTSLPSLPASLTALNCEYNQISALPALPGSLTHLICSNNSLTSFPALPGSLINLNCYNNQLTALPALPSSLIYLNCSDNQIANLPLLPGSLANLYCSNNQLSGLPTLPNSLSSLYCSNNQLINLPTLPLSLNELNCSHNLLTALPSLPVGLDMLICSHNTISCFPLLPPIPVEFDVAPNMVLRFDISSNPFTCLPNYIPAMNVGTLNFPLCAPGNANGCTVAEGIAGIVYHDTNQDCNKGSSETGINNAIVKVYDNTNTFIGLASGLVNKSYFIPIPAGAYKVILDTINKPYRVQCIDPGIDSLVTLTSSQLIEDSVNFAITCKPGFDIGFEWGRPRFNTFPGVTHTLTMVAGDLGHLNNLYCPSASGISGTVTFTITGPITYVGPAPGALTPAVSGNIYTYTIADFGMVQNFTDFILRFTTNTGAQTGDQICVDGLIVTTAGDYNPANNTYQFCYVVGNSYDPNKKEVFPKEVAPGFNDWLTYTIHFRNTGAAAAMNVRLLDTLEAKLDPETFQVLSSSHSNMIDLTGTILNVRFPNIQLSSPIVSQDGALGFFRYRIKPKPGWVNDTIRNKANIYFDYNAPIVTNTAKTYFMTVTDVANKELSGSFTIYPNPANSVIHLKISENKASINTYRITLMDVLGKEILNESYKEEIDISHLEKSIYFLSLYQNGSLLSTKKLIKE